MNPTQILLLAKIGAVGVLFFGLYGIGHHSGEKAIQERWDASKVLLMQSQAKLVAEHDKATLAIQQENELRSINAETKYEQAIADLNQKYTAAVAASNAAGGLRIPKPNSCSGVATATASKGPSSADEATTIRLPAETERRLFELAQSADETSLQLVKLQKWIIDSGLYPKE